MKKATSVLSFVCFLFVSAILCNATDMGKKTVAVVNGKEIPWVTYERKLAETKMNIERTGQSFNEEDMKKVNSMVLENIINNELLYQEGVRKGYKSNDLKIEVQFQRIKGQFETDEQFSAILKERGYTVESLYEDIDRMITIEDYVDGEIAKKVTISEEAMLDYYNNNPDVFNEPEQVRASHILIAVDDMTDESKMKDAVKLIKQIEKKLKKGEEFETLAREYSQCPSSEKGGDLGYFGRGQMVKPFENSAFSLEPGEVSGIVQTRYGYHLVKLVDKKPERIIPFSEVKESIKQFLGEQIILEQVELLIGRLRKEAEIERFIEGYEN
ncbi:MAG: peptidylprolyl isomerase [Spirochaetota bacterium]|nr:MAG: peptidylprolyl isomerase [Spirochaetota bacterium]